MPNSTPPSTRWRFGVDRGGTFTDVIGLAPDGSRHTAKVLSESDHYLDAGIEGIGQILGIPTGQPLPGAQIESIRMGTTVATNALLERKGAPTGLLTTAGFADLLEIGDQTRPDLFALAIRKPGLLYQAVAEAPERLTADGEILTPFDEAATLAALQALKAQGIESLAIVFLHAWRNPIHETRAAALARQVGFAHISTSSQTMPLIGAVGRGRTTLVDAYLTPVLARYVARIRPLVGEIPLHFMTSSGALAAPDGFAGKDAILSGPAGGVLGVAEVAGRSGEAAILGFDMGGTSTDVCRYAGSLERVLEVEAAGVAFKVPMLAVETVAAGGGSILGFDGRRLLVGPESAGADPGPACYGRGGPAAVTDANVVLGRIQPEWFPHVFGPERTAPLDVAASRERLQGLADAVAVATGTAVTVEQLALDYLQVAVEAMVRPIKDLSVAKGLDPAEHTLVAFGGAGGQVACAIARALSMRKVLIPPLGSLLSAWGILTAPRRRTAVESVLLAGDEAGVGHVAGRVAALSARLEGELRGDGVTGGLTLQARVDVRVVGTDASVEVEWVADAAVLRGRFDAAHRLRFGFGPAGGLEIAGVSVEVFEEGAFLQGQKNVGAAPPPRSFSSDEPKGIGPSFDELRMSANQGLPQNPNPDLPIDATLSLIFEQGTFETPVLRREALPVGVVVSGPALIVEEHSTVVVEPGFAVSLQGDGCLAVEEAEVETAGVERLALRRAQGERTFVHQSPDGSDHGARTVATRNPNPLMPSFRSSRARRGTRYEPINPDVANGLSISETVITPAQLEIFHHRFMSIAEQMGDLLARTAHSVNIKERKDFSCALFDDAGRLIANAPHVPVHLGAMGETVRAILKSQAGRMQPGDAFAGNDPDAGGSHLPDITVVAPVFRDGVPLFYVAARGHHADIGGIAPGSMPPHATTLEEEGVVLRDLPVLQAGVFQEEAILKALQNHPWPARNLPERLSDLRAQVAAIHRGVTELSLLCDTFGDGYVTAMMDAIRSDAQAAMEEALAPLLGDAQEKTFRFEDTLDDGSPIRVAVTLRRDEKGVHGVVDFAGTAPRHPGNLNAPPAVARAAVLYVLRLLIARPIPLNDGCLAPIEIRIPPGSLLDPGPGAAVGGGNVETSQRLVDVLLGALGVAAASQGTMNNLLFGDPAGRGGQYYETIAGGSGGCAAGPGASAVQVHMTNTRITDPEILESRFAQVRLERFGLRRGSGGAGRQPGGDGVIRTLRFMQRQSVSILSQRRDRAPFGLAGGGAGTAGVNRLLRSDGSIEPLPGRFQGEVEAGEGIEIQTPGGGGFGKPTV